MAVFLEIQEQQKWKEAQAKDSNRHLYSDWDLAMAPIVIESLNGTPTSRYLFNSPMAGFGEDPHVYSKKNLLLDDEYVFLDTNS